MASGLRQEIRAYEKMRAELEIDYFGEWVVVHDSKVAGTYESFESAAEDAVARFGRGPYLIRRIGASAPPLPASFALRGPFV